MPDVCDPTTTPDPGGPFPIETDTEDYEYTRTFLIYAQAITAGDDLIESVLIDIMPVNEPDARGTPKSATTTWRHQLLKLLQLQVPPLPARADRLFSTEISESGPQFLMMADRTPLDFSVYAKTCIILRLVGDFWSFRYDRPATTKRNLGRQYYNLERHVYSGAIVQTPVPTSDFQCISFFCKQPCPDRLNVRHGLNLHTDIVVMANGNEERLPIIIDPDIENKGGNTFFLHSPMRAAEELA